MLIFARLHRRMPQSSLDWPRVAHQTSVFDPESQVAGKGSKTKREGHQSECSASATMALLKIKRAHLTLLLFSENPSRRKNRRAPRTRLQSFQANAPCSVRVNPGRRR